MNIAAQSSLMVTDHQGTGKGDRVLFLPAPPPTPFMCHPRSCNSASVFWGKIRMILLKVCVCVCVCVCVLVTQSSPTL